MPLALTAASSLFIVSFGPSLLRIVVNPSTAIAYSACTSTRLFSCVAHPSFGNGRRLDLNRSTMLARGSRRDHQIAALHARFTTDDLTDRPPRIDDRGPCRIGRERRQRFEDAAAIRLKRKREHVRALRLEPDCPNLEPLQQPLVEERHARGAGLARRSPAPRQRQQRHLSRDAERLQAL